MLLQDYVRLDDAQVTERFVAVEDRKRRNLERRERDMRRAERKRQAQARHLTESSDGKPHETGTACL